MTTTNLHVFRKMHPDTHRTIPLGFLDDAENLSWRACGLLAYLLTRPVGWQVWRADLVNRHTEGRDAVINAVKELREAGYVRHQSVPRKGTLWYLNETPLTDEEWAARIEELRRTGFQSTMEAMADGFSVHQKPVPLHTSTTKKQTAPPFIPPGGKKQRKVSKRKTALPADFEPSDSHRERAVKLKLDLDDQLEDFRLHAEATGRRMVSWSAAFTTWLKKAPEMGFSNGRRGRPQPQVDPFDQTDAHRAAQKLYDAEVAALDKAMAK